MRRAAALALVALLSAPALAADPVAVSNAWIRATVPGQKVAGGYMDLKAASDATLIAVETPAAEESELHSMTMEGGVGRMRALDSLALPAGKTVSLKPGGKHLMLFGIKKRLQPGDKVPLTLIVQGRDGKKSSVKVEVPVRPIDDEDGQAGHRH